MDTLLLARLQFATTTSFHFLFVTLSLGLVVFVAGMQTAYAVSGKAVYARMTKFWGTLYVINYALGIVTGLVMEFQFGLNWGGLSEVAGNVFGAPLALETLIAFFVEATFLGMWIFGWNRLPKWIHLALIWLVAVAAYASALWILAANAFLQNPVGHEMRDGRAYLTDFGALLRNDSLTDSLPHVVSAALLAGGLFVAGISAWHFIRRTDEVEVFRRSLRWGVVAAPVGAFSIIHFGFLQEVAIERYQPMKLAVIYQESARLEAARQLMLQRFGPGDFAPPSWIAIPYQIMMNGAFVLALATLACLVLLFRNWLIRLRVPLYALVVMMPVPFILMITGWLVREVGRQPWAVYGLLTTEQAVSDVPPGLVLASYVGFTLVLGLLVVLDYWLIATYARRGPRHTLFGTTLAEPARDRLTAY
ncbi:cytochrome ubiquinol oxidase subunit I [Microtetraspora malaysiensis]|uniref:cytochrome ubiquinol oxidase subunit I n=1 Tax=Microtetraspora malaysiensis TaxID=161358 RepID=UPI003D9157CE